VTDLATNPQGEGESASAVPLNAKTNASEANAEVADANLAGDQSTDSQAEDGSDTPQPALQETDEVEHEGRKYRVPKALKPAFMMNADYTRKTQEVAEQRRALEERQTALFQQVKSQADHMQDVGRILAYGDALATYDKMDWQQLRQQNPQAAQDSWLQYMQLKDSRDKAALALQQRMQQSAFDQQRTAAKQIEECRLALQRDIKDWSPDLAGKLMEFGAREFGFTPHEVQTVTDPRLFRLLHRAFLGEQAIKRAAASAKLANSDGLKPVPQVGSRSSANGTRPTDRQSVDEWMRSRNEQLRKPGLRS